MASNILVGIGSGNGGLLPGLPLPHPTPTTTTIAWANDDFLLFAHFSEFSIYFIL